VEIERRTEVLPAGKTKEAGLEGIAISGKRLTGENPLHLFH
jgi:hypothetical protein